MNTDTLTEPAPVLAATDEQIAVRWLSAALAELRAAYPGADLWHMWLGSNSDRGIQFGAYCGGSVARATSLEGLRGELNALLSPEGVKARNRDRAAKLREEADKLEASA